MSKKERKVAQTEVISFRLTKDEYEQFNDAISQSGLKRGPFFKGLVLSKSNVVVQAVETKTVDRKLVFLFNKISNNINQLAKNSNRAHLTGLINTTHYKLLLNRLINIEDLLNNMIKNSK